MNIESSGPGVKREADGSRGLIDLNGHPAYPTFVDHCEDAQP
jgi:hypothetical protein